MVIFAKVSAWIAGPVIVALLGGKYIDRVYNSAPYGFLVLTGIAFIISITMLVKLSREYIQNIEAEVAEKKKQEQNGKPN